MYVYFPMEKRLQTRQGRTATHDVTCQRKIIINSPLQSPPPLGQGGTYGWDLINSIKWTHQLLKYQLEINIITFKTGISLIHK